MSNTTVNLRDVLFAETRVKALDDTTMVVALQERLPGQLRGRFPEIGLVVRWLGAVKKPFDVVSLTTNGERIWFMLHIGMPDGVDVRSQLQFDHMDDIASVVREFAAKRGWVLASYREKPDASPSLFGVGFHLLPDKQKQTKNSDMPTYLYHLADMENVESIRNGGLKPMTKRSKARSYPGRVYVFSDKELMENMLQLSIEIHHEIAKTGSSYSTPLTKTPHIAIVKIDPSKLRKGTKFYIDPEFDGEPGAVYTYTHIPPEAIVGFDQVS